MTKLLLRLFLKNSDDFSNAKTRSACGKLAGLVGIVCNVLLFAVKFIVGTLSGSISITADAVNNLTDASSSVVTMIGFRLAEKPADEDHPYGHARAEYITGLIVTAMILIIGWELAKSSVTKILHPQPVSFSWVLAGILLLSVGVKLWLAGFYRSLSKKIQSSTLMATAADSRNDVIATGAVLISCLVGMLTDFNPDGYVGLLVALFILLSGIGIAKDTIDPLLGVAPDKAMVERIRCRLLQYDHVLGIHDLMVHDYGPGQRFASVHVEMDKNLDPLFSHNIIDEIERDFAKTESIQLVVHYDPTVTDDEEMTQARTMVEEIVKSIDQRLSIHDFRMVAGPLHTNVIFDMAVPFDEKINPAVLREQVAEAIRTQCPDYYAVIHLDSCAFN